MCVVRKIMAGLALCGSVCSARGDGWNLYDGAPSIYIAYEAGGREISPQINLGFDESGEFSEFTMDTGSVGIVASPDRFQPGPDSTYLGPGRQVYSSSGVIEVGDWYTATQQIYDDNGVLVATAQVPVLLVTSIECEPDARDCTRSDKPKNIAMMGIGFAREHADTPDSTKTPAYNAFLNLTAVRLTPDGPLVPVPDTWNNGYVVTAHGVHLGLSRENTSDAGFVKLRPNPAFSTAEHTEWRPAKMGIAVNDKDGEGHVLMDTGVGVGYLTPPHGSIPSGTLVQCPASDHDDCAPDKTTIAVSLPGQEGLVAFFSYTIENSGTAAGDLEPDGVVVDYGDDVFFNTSRYVLQGLDYIYDAKNGFVGYRWKDPGNTSGYVKLILALENDFAMPDGFATDFPVALFGETRLSPEGTATFSNVISGSHKLFIEGPGQVILAAANDYTGDTEIHGGRLIVNGSIASHAIVYEGGTLGGTGEVHDVHVAAGGIYAPGNSIGTQIVRHDLRFDAGGIFEVEVDPTHGDKAEVHGAIDLSGAVLQLIMAPGRYGQQTAYEIIDNRSGAAASGEFGQIDNPYVFFLPSVDYDHGLDHDVVLTLTRSSDYSAVAVTPNERAVATALQYLPPDDPLIEAIQLQTLSGALQAFDALSGEVYAATAGVIVDQSRYVRQTLLARLLQAGAGGGGATALASAAAPSEVAAAPAGMMALGAGGDDWGARQGSSLPDLVFWTKGYGAWGSFDGDGNAASASRNLGGVLTGADTRLDRGWRLGLAAGYSQASVNVGGRNSSASVDTVHLAGYAGGLVGPAVLRSGAAWGWNSIDASRSVVFPGFFAAQEASYGGDVGQAFAELALPAALHGVPVEPFAGLAFVHVGMDGFAESGPLAGLVAAGGSEQVGYSTLGLRLASVSSIEGYRLTSRVSAAWQHAFGDVTPQAALAFAAGGPAFVVGGVPIARDSALIEVGLGAELSPSAMIELSYFGQLAADARDNAVEGRFRWAF